MLGRLASISNHSLANDPNTTNSGNGISSISSGVYPYTFANPKRYRCQSRSMSVSKSGLLRLV